MNVANSTKWLTTDLLKLFRRCVVEVNKIEKPAVKHTKSYRFSLDIKNSSSLRGRAILNGYWIMLKIPREWKNDNEIGMQLECKIKLARLIIHEYYHTLGYSYHDKKNYKHDFTKKWDVEWVKHYQIKIKTQKIEASKDIRAIRYERAIKNLRNAETKLKRAKTLHAKWLAKTKYYEKCLAVK